MASVKYIKIINELNDFFPSKKFCQNSFKKYIKKKERNVVLNGIKYFRYLNLQPAVQYLAN